MYKLVFYTPEKYKEAIKKALFEKGAGRYMRYDMCAFETKGHGQFRGLNDSDPFIGKKDILERIEEYRVEMICNEKILKQVVQTLIDTHPYEEPAYELYKIINSIDDI
jgi:hypothetical protein